jgi:hypothetical protein
MIGLGAPIVQASDVTWNYVGAPLDQCTFIGCDNNINNLPTTDFLSLTITFNGPLAASSFYDGNAPIKSWAMTDTAGFVDLSSTIGSPITQAVFSTDANRNIVGPYSFLSFFNPATRDFPPDDICCGNHLLAASINYDVGITDINDQFLGFVSLTGVPGADFIQVYPNIYPSFYAACANQNVCNQEQYSLADGTWSLAPTTTPLPSALPLLATGLGALGLLGWRRKRKNTAAVAA